MKNEMNSIYAGTISTAKNGKAVHQAVRKMRAFEQAQKEMSGLNTMRGGSKASRASSARAWKQPKLRRADAIPSS